MKEIRASLHGAYHRMFEILFEKLRELGFETQTPNPMDGKKPEEFDTNWVGYNSINLEYKGTQ